MCMESHKPKHMNTSHIPHILWPHSRMRSSTVDCHQSGDAEGGVDPAVGVHHTAGDLLHHTVNGISKELTH